MTLLGHFLHDLQRLRQGLGGLVGPVAGGERLEDIGDSHHAGQGAHAIPGQAPGITPAVHPFVVPAGDLRHLRQVVRKGEGGEHHDGLDDVFVDLVAFLVAQGAAGDHEVFQLAPVIQQVRDRHGEAPGIVRAKPLVGRSFEAMRGAVAQERLSRRQVGLGFGRPAPTFLGGDAEPVVQGAQPGARGDVPQARDTVRGHELTALVARRHEGKVVIQLLPGGVALGARRLGVGPSRQGAQVIDLGIALEDLKTHPHLMDAVIEGFQLGGLVDDVFRGGDLAAVMQPGGDVQGFPLVGVHAEVGVGACGLAANGLCEQLHDLWDPGAMATGIGALGVDGRCHHPDEGLEQGLLGGDQFAGLQGHRGKTGQGLHEADAGRIQALPTEQDQHADGVPGAVEEGQAHCVQGGQAKAGAVGLLGLEGEGLAPGQGRLAGKGIAVTGQVIQVEGLGIPEPRHGARGTFARGHQEQQAAVGLGRLGGGPEQFWHEAVEIRFVGEAGDDVQEVRQGRLGMTQGGGEFINLKNEGFHLNGAGEVEAPDGFGLPDQSAEGLGDAPRQPDGHRQAQEQQDQYQQQRLPPEAMSLGQHFRFRHRHAQIGVLIIPQGQVQRGEVPGLPRQIEAPRSPRRRYAGAALVQLGEEGVWVAAIRRILRDGVTGQRMPLAVPQDQPGTRGDAQVREQGAQGVQSHVGPEDRPTTDGPAGEGESPLLGGEEGVGCCHDQAVAFAGQLEPGALARIEIQAPGCMYPTQLA
jgi:hypothetical protein